MMLSSILRRRCPSTAVRLFSSNSSVGTGKIVMPPRPKQKVQSDGKVITERQATTNLIKTNLDQYYAHLKSLKLINPDDSTVPPLSLPDESGIVTKDLTEEMVNIRDLYDPRIHLPSQPLWSKEGYEEGTPLTAELIAYIAVRNRPLTVSDYMSQALTHPLYGYYTNPTNSTDGDDWDDDDDDFEDESTTTKPDYIIGSKGDFVTAPEMSQVFGECMVVWFITQWQVLHRPLSINIVEVGPGKGTLITDILRSCLTSFGEGIGSTISAVHLVEASPAMRLEQQNKLKALAVEAGVRFKFSGNDDDTKTSSDDDNSADKDSRLIQVSWYDTFTMFMTKQGEAKVPTFIISQEFIDALPVHAFQKTDDGWRERMVDVAVREDQDDKIEVKKEPPTDDDDDDDLFKDDVDETLVKKPRLRFVTSQTVTPACKTLLQVDEDGHMGGDDSPVGQVVEVCPEGILFAQDVANFLERNTGAALICDYGQEGSTDSLRGFSKHKQVSFLSQPGQVDVTADVDFGALKKAVNDMPGDDVKERSIFAFGPVEQGNFLIAMGAGNRVVSLIENEETTDEEAEELTDALERLCAPNLMGQRYKVMAIAAKKEDIFAPPGF